MNCAARLVLAATMALAACGDAPSPEAAPTAPAATPVDASATPAPPAPALAPVTTLAGAWRVAGIDDAPIEGDVGIALTGDGKEIWWDPRCAGLSARYRIEGARFEVVDQPGAEGTASAEKAPAQVVCLVAIPMEASRAINALRAATRIERTPQNGILLSGNGHSLLLFSQ